MFLFVFVWRFSQHVWQTCIHIRRRHACIHIRTDLNRLQIFTYDKFFCSGMHLFANIFRASQNNVCKKTKKSFKIWNETKQNEIAKIFYVITYFIYTLFALRVALCIDFVWTFHFDLCDKAKNIGQRYFFLLLSSWALLFPRIYTFCWYHLNDISIYRQIAGNKLSVLIIESKKCRQFWFF